jgi:hypothetical protein
VLEHVGGVHQIEAFVREWQLFEIRQAIHAAGKSVRRNVPSAQGTEPLLQKRFWSQVQDAGVAEQPLIQAVQHQSLQPVPLQAAAGRTASVQSHALRLHQVCKRPAVTAYRAAVSVGLASLGRQPEPRGAGQAPK